MIQNIIMNPNTKYKKIVHNQKFRLNFVFQVEKNNYETELFLRTLTGFREIHEGFCSFSPSPFAALIAVLLLSNILINQTCLTGTVFVSVIGFSVDVCVFDSKHTVVRNFKNKRLNRLNVIM